MPYRFLALPNISFCDAWLVLHGQQPTQVALSQV